MSRARNALAVCSPKSKTGCVAWVDASPVLQSKHRRKSCMEYSHRIVQVRFRRQEVQQFFLNAAEFGERTLPSVVALIVGPDAVSTLEARDLWAHDYWPHDTVGPPESCGGRRLERALPSRRVLRR